MFQPQILDSIFHVVECYRLEPFPQCSTLRGSFSFQCVHFLIPNVLNPCRVQQQFPLQERGPSQAYSGRLEGVTKREAYTTRIKLNKMETSEAVNHKSLILDGKKVNLVPRLNQRLMKADGDVRVSYTYS